MQKNAGILTLLPRFDDYQPSRLSLYMVSVFCVSTLKPSTKELVFARQSTLFGLLGLRHYLKKSETLPVKTGMCVVKTKKW